MYHGNHGLKKLLLNSLLSELNIIIYRLSFYQQTDLLSQCSAFYRYRARHTLFGSLQEDKVTWNGMVGDLQMKSADAAVAPLSITKIRSKAIDFTLPIQMVRWGTRGRLFYISFVTQGEQNLIICTSYWFLGIILQKGHQRFWLLMQLN